MRLVPTQQAFEAVLDWFGYSLGYSEASGERQLIRRREVDQLREQVDRLSADLVELKVGVKKVPEGRAPQEAHLESKAIQQVERLTRQFEELRTVVDELRTRPTRPDVPADPGQETPQRVDRLTAQVRDLQGVVDELRTNARAPKSDVKAQTTKQVDRLVTNFQDLQAVVEELRNKPVDQKVAPDLGQQAMERVDGLSAQLLGLQVVVDKLRGGPAEQEPAETEACDASQLTHTDLAETATNQQARLSETAQAEESTAAALTLFVSERSPPTTNSRIPSILPSSLDAAGDRGNEQFKGLLSGLSSRARQWLRRDDGEGDGTGEEESSTPEPPIGRERLFRMLEDQSMTKAPSSADSQEKPTE
jgi:hypothetical protein